MPAVARRIAAVGLLALLAATMPGGAAARTIEGPATVRSDGTIHIHNDVIRLFGIWLPRTGRTCSTLLNPTFCAPAPVVVLYERVRGFLLCQAVRALDDGTIEAYCGIRARRLFEPREDLGAMLVAEGWAVARSDAPAEYHALQRIAESQELGIWGNKVFQVR